MAGFVCEGRYGSADDLHLACAKFDQVLAPIIILHAQREEFLFFYDIS